MLALATWTKQFWAVDVPNQKVELPRGMLLAEAFNDGPAYLNSSSNRLILLESKPSFDEPKSLASVAKPRPSTVLLLSTLELLADTTTDTVGGTYMQDTRDWFAVHLRSLQRPDG